MSLLAIRNPNETLPLTMKSHTSNRHRYNIVDLDPKWQLAPPSALSNELLGSLNCDYVANLIMIIVPSVLEIASGVAVIVPLN